MQTLNTEDVKTGINNSLYLLRLFLQSGNIILFRKNNSSKYVHKVCDSKIGEMIKPISCIVNKTSHLIELKGLLQLDLNLSDRIADMLAIHISLDKTEWILFINKLNKEKKLEPHFWEKAKDTMQIILKRAASYEKNTSAITTDLLTGLDNRNSYEMAIRKIDESCDNLVFGIFDLFRLKYVNDNYSHAIGDDYIKKVADILNKYWPKNRVVINDDETESFIETGHTMYRIGGDEFVLLTTKENYELANIKAKLAQEEASLITLGVNIDLPLGFNYGIVSHNSNDSIKQTSMRADEIMQEDKRLMYSKCAGIERRK